VPASTQQQGPAIASLVPPVPVRWHEEVVKFMQWVQNNGCVTHHVIADDKVAFMPSVCQIPHPDKVQSGGEDSFFLSEKSLGVADGVGEWRVMGINPRSFADEVMNGASGHLSSAEVEASAQEAALSSLREGFKNVKSWGSATAIVVTLDAADHAVGIANLGDSSFRQLRKVNPSTPDGSSEVKIIARTKEQQHSYNCPFQLVHKPKPADYEGILAQGKEELNELVKRCSDGSLPVDDPPESAELYSFPVEQGDLLILGSDGVFDNLYDHEICELAEQMVWPLEVQDGDFSLTHPEHVAKTLSFAAYFRACDGNANTPFSDSARHNNVNFRGGKMDDITVVCAWVMTRSTSS